MKRTFVLHENPLVLFTEKMAPILILRSIFLLICDNFEIAFEFKDSILLFLIVIIALSMGIVVLFFINSFFIMMNLIFK